MFDYFQPPRVTFGLNSITKLPEIIKSLGSRSFIIHNGPQVDDSILALLGTPTIHRQKGEPTVQHVESALTAAKESHADVILAVGGGSAIDCAKAVAGLLTNGGSPTDYMEVVGQGKKITRPAMNWIAIPTTAGTGAEATRNAVIGLPEKKYKASIRSEHLLPRAVLIDPQLGVNVSKETTAASGMDALCQLIESYTSTGANAFTDALANRGISLAVCALPHAFTDGKNLEARSDMAIAAYWSGVCLTNAGLGAVHGFAAPLGANFPIPHGVVCAALLPHVMKANVEALREQSQDHPTLKRYADIGQATSQQAMSEQAAVQHAIDAITQLVRDLGIPRLNDFGLTPDRVAEMASLAKKASSMRFNPVTLSDEQLAAVLHEAI